MRSLAVVGKRRAPAACLFTACNRVEGGGAHNLVGFPLAHGFLSKCALMCVSGCKATVNHGVTPAVPIASALVAAGLSRVAMKACAVSSEDVVLIQQIKFGNRGDGVELAHMNLSALSAVDQHQASEDGAGAQASKDDQGGHGSGSSLAGGGRIWGENVPVL